MIQLNLRHQPSPKSVESADGSVMYPTRFAGFTFDGYIAPQRSALGEIPTPLSFYQRIGGTLFRRSFEPQMFINCVAYGKQNGLVHQSHVIRSDGFAGRF